MHPVHPVRRSRPRHWLYQHGSTGDPTLQKRLLYLAWPYGGGGECAQNEKPAGQKNYDDPFHVEYFQL